MSAGFGDSGGGCGDGDFGFILCTYDGDDVHEDLEV